MKIGFITDDYHPRIDGVIVYIDTMSEALKNLGHEVFIICPKYPGHEKSAGNIIRTSSYDPLPFSKLTSRMMITNKKTLKQIEELDLDIVHSHTHAGANFAAYAAAKQQDTKLINTMHTTYHSLIGVYPWTTLLAVLMGNFLSFRYHKDWRALRSLFTPPFPLKKKTSKWMNSYIRSVLDYSDLVITNSSHTKKYVESFGSDTEIKIVRNGIERSKFKAKTLSDKSGTFQFVLTSRISGEKRQEIAICALADVVNKGFDCHLTLIGGGPNRHKCDLLINELGMKNRVTITGEVEQSDVKKSLAIADVSLFTSYHFDTDPLAIMEYLDAGLPVIYCDENFDHMFEKGAAKRCGRDYESFALAMEQIISDNDKLKDMNRLARKSSEKHDVIDRANELIQVYEDILKSD